MDTTRQMDSIEVISTDQSRRRWSVGEKVGLMCDAPMNLHDGIAGVGRVGVGYMATLYKTIST